MLNLLGFMMPGLPEMLIVGAIILLLFGGAKVPSLMRNLGRGVTEFKKGISGDEEDDPPKEIEDK